MRRANRLGGGYQPIQQEPEEITEEGEINQEPEDTEEDSIILRGDNLPIVDLSKYNTEERRRNTSKSPHCGEVDIEQKDHGGKHLKG